MPTRDEGHAANCATRMNEPGECDCRDEVTVTLERKNVQRLLDMRNQTLEQPSVAAQAEARGELASALRAALQYAQSLAEPEEEKR